jgi:hypothetical protein
MVPPESEKHISVSARLGLRKCDDVEIQARRRARPSGRVEKLKVEREEKGGRKYRVDRRPKNED